MSTNAILIDPFVDSITINAIPINTNAILIYLVVVLLSINAGLIIFY